MSEKVNLAEELNGRTFLGSLLLEVMTDYHNAHGNKKESVIETFKMNVEEGVGCWANVKVVVNGFECETIDFFKRTEQQLERMIEERAIELLKERCSVLTDTISSMERIATDAFPLARREY